LSKSVFISHAVKDKALVKEIVDLIEDGMGLPKDEIFCSSLTNVKSLHAKSINLYPAAP
jgi:hypothetical protein